MSRLRLIVIFLLLVMATQLSAQDEPVTHRYFLSWDVNTELSLSVFANVGDLGYCNLTQVYEDDCVEYIDEHGDPIVDYIDSKRFAKITWREIEGYESFGICVNKELFDYGDGLFAGHLTVVAYTNDQLDQVYTIPINDQLLPCLGDFALEGEFLDMDFIGDAAVGTAPKILPEEDDAIIVRLIQPEDSKVIMMVNITPPGVTTPNFAFAFRDAALDEIPTDFKGTDTLVFPEDMQSNTLTFFVAYASPDSVEAAGGVPAQFAVAIYEQGILTAIYFGQLRSIDQGWMGVYNNLYLDPLALNEYHPAVNTIDPLANSFPQG
jgi:hypothetical protein